MNSGHCSSQNAKGVENKSVPDSRLEAYSIEVHGGDRWLAYQRLQELEISCTCGYYQPLMVQVHSVLALLQVWSVLRQTTAARPLLAAYLERCWQAS